MPAALEAPATMLPEPALTFTIPSLHDDTTLSCRIFHPLSLAPHPRSPQSLPPWRKHAAVIAHPYAPLGGCADDPVVATIAATLLRRGLVVGTFDFRGAGGSGGRTSWTSRAERADYMSFAGFVAYYVHHLDDAPGGAGAGAPLMLLCGYSYGAMVTTLLPPLETTLALLAAPRTASAAADIRLRAQHLAERHNAMVRSVRAAAAEGRAMSPRSAAFAGLRVGGDEDKRRSQEHGRRSFSIDAEDRIRKGVADLRQKAKSHQGGHHHHHIRHGKRMQDLKGGDTPPTVKEQDETAVEDKAEETLPPAQGFVTPKAAYLLVSPPVGWATNLMTLSWGGLFGKRSKPPKDREKDDEVVSSEKGDAKDAGAPRERDKLVDSPTLAIYGDSDVFVAVKRFREWASRLQSVPGSKFRAHEVSSAGHFYVEQGTMQKLASAVSAFSGDLLAQTPTRG